jgi:hypothetical protein
MTGSRNWPPVPAFCIRWRFPTFELDMEADPSALKQTSGRGGYEDAAWTRHLTDEPLAYSALKKLVQKDTGMADSTFKSRLSILVAQDKALKTVSGEYMRGPGPVNRRAGNRFRPNSSSKHYDPLADEGVK